MFNWSINILLRVFVLLEYYLNKVLYNYKCNVYGIKLTEL